MKTVWNLLSENNIMDRPNIQTYETEADAIKMVQELFQVYCAEHNLDPSEPEFFSAEDVYDGKYYRFSGGIWEEWVYVLECDIVRAVDQLDATIGVLDEDVE